MTYKWQHVLILSNSVSISLLSSAKRFAVSCQTIFTILLSKIGEQGKRMETVNGIPGSIWILNLWYK